MSELERLTEALEWYESGQKVRLQGWVPLQWIVKAARAYRDLLANGQRVEWCEEHDAAMTRLPVADSPRDRGLCWKGELGEIPQRGRQLCRIVSKLLSVYPKEAENGPD